MASNIAKALYNWMVGYRALVDRPLTRQDYQTTWGDLGGAVYDWGNALYAQGMSGTVQDEGSFTSIVDQLEGQGKLVGGTIGAMYAPPPGETSGGTGYQFGNLGNDMYDFLQLAMGPGGPPIRDHMIQQYGQLGGQVYDWWLSLVQMGKTPDQATFAARADYMALTTPPAGPGGAGYVAAPPSPADQANLDYINAQIDNLKKQGLLTDAQAELAKAQALQLAIQGKLTEAQTGQIIQDIKMKEAELLANPRDWIKAWFYQRGLTPPPDAAAAPPPPAPGPGGYPAGTVLGGNIAGAPNAPTGAPVGGLTPTSYGQPPAPGPGGYPIGTVLGGNIAGAPNAPPGAPVGGLTPTSYGQPPPTTTQSTSEVGAPPIPPWLSAIQTNTALPQFSGSSGSLGTFPIKAPDPNQITARVYNRMNPSEISGLEGLASSSGWSFPDYITQMFRSQTRQGNVNPYAVTSWGGF